MLVLVLYCRVEYITPDKICQLSGPEGDAGILWARRSARDRVGASIVDPLISTCGAPGYFRSHHGCSEPYSAYCFSCGDTSNYNWVLDDNSKEIAVKKAGATNSMRSSLQPGNRPNSDSPEF